MKNYEIIEYYPNFSRELIIQMLTHKPHNLILFESAYCFNYIVEQITCTILQDIELRNAIILLDRLLNK